MGRNYVIQWKSTVNGRAGRGTKLFDREEAQRLAAELNRDFPQIHHEAVPAPPPPPAGPQSELESDSEPARDRLPAESAPSPVHALSVR